MNNKNLDIIAENLRGKMFDEFFEDFEKISSESEIDLLLNGDKAAEIRFRNYVDSRDDLFKIGKFYYNFDEVIGLIDRYNR
jgi:hypothetical protein